jgi:hypothetical protein
MGRSRQGGLPRLGSKTAFGSCEHQPLLGWLEGICAGNALTKLRNSFLDRSSRIGIQQRAKSVDGKNSQSNACDSPRQSNRHLA